MPRVLKNSFEILSHIRIIKPTKKDNEPSKPIEANGRLEGFPAMCAYRVFVSAFPHLLNLGDFPTKSKARAAVNAVLPLYYFTE